MTDCRCAAGRGRREQLVVAGAEQTPGDPPDAPHLPKPELFQAPETVEGEEEEE